MRKHSKIASIVNIVVNLFLFVIKIIVGLVFGSVSLVADALNSLSDIIAAFFIFVCVRINDEEADDTHEFGHSRAENIAGYTVGILMFFLGVSIIKIAIEKLWYHEVSSYSGYMLLVVGITFFLKLGLYGYIKSVLKKERSPALKANLQDHLNDMVIIIGVLFAIIGIKAGYYFIDPIIGIIIGLFIIKGAYGISKENIHYLMGIPADKKTLRSIVKLAMDEKDVLGVRRIKSQYLGNKVQIEIHVEFDKKMSLEKSHDLGVILRKKIEALDEVNNCFVHIDPK